MSRDLDLDRAREWLRKHLPDEPVEIAEERILDAAAAVVARGTS